MPRDYYATDLGELDEKVKSMMEKDHNTCQTELGRLMFAKSVENKDNGLPLEIT